MPYLMLKFEVTREVQQEDIIYVQLRTTPPGREHIKLTMIDTDKGNVVELSADATNVKQIERPPKTSEIHASSNVLGKGIGKGVSKVDFDAVVKERDEYRKESAHRGLEVRDLRSELISLGSETDRLRKKVEQNNFTDDSKNLLSAALDNYIEYLFSSNQLNSYEDAKKLYKHLTGRSWVTGEDDSDDDEEEDSRIFRTSEDRKLRGEVSRERTREGNMTLVWNLHEMKLMNDWFINFNKDR